MLSRAQKTQLRNLIALRTAEPAQAEALEESLEDPLVRLITKLDKPFGVARRAVRAAARETLVRACAGLQSDQVFRWHCTAWPKRKAYEGYRARAGLLLAEALPDHQAVQAVTAELHSLSLSLDGPIPGGALVAFRSLRWLTIAGEVRHATPIASLKHLERIDAQEARGDLWVDAPALEVLRAGRVIVHGLDEARQLRTLELSVPPMPNVLPELPRLERLHVSYPFESIDGIGSATKLLSATLCGPVDASAMCDHPALGSLDVDEWNDTGALDGLHTLESLVLHPSEPGLGWKVGLHRLRTIDLKHSELLSLDGIEHATSLTRLDADRLKKLTDAGALLEHPTLEEVSLVGASSLHQVGRSPPARSGMPRVHTIDLSTSAIRSLDGLAPSPCLRTLEARNAKELSDVSALKDHPRLEVLDLTGCEALETVEGLGRLPKLRRLILKGTAVKPARIPEGLLDRVEPASLVRKRRASLTTRKTRGIGKLKKKLLSRDFDAIDEALTEIGSPELFDALTAGTQRATPRIRRPCCVIEPGPLFAGKRVRTWRLYALTHLLALAPPKTTTALVAASVRNLYVDHAVRLSVVSKLPALERLEFCDAVLIDCDLRETHSLTSLFAERTNFREPLLLGPAMKRLTIYVSKYSADALGDMTTWGGLESLNLSSATFSNADGLRQLPALQTLTLQNMELDAASCESIKALPRLRKVELIRVTASGEGLLAELIDTIGAKVVVHR